MKYIIPVYWTVDAEITIEAESLEEAITCAHNDDLPDGVYVDDSFKINIDALKELNNLNKDDRKYAKNWYK
jgi:hypothetical protein